MQFILFCIIIIHNPYVLLRITTKKVLYFDTKIILKENKLNVIFFDFK